MLTLFDPNPILTVVACLTQPTDVRTNVDEISEPPQIVVAGIDAAVACHGN